MEKEGERGKRKKGHREWEKVKEIRKKKEGVGKNGRKKEKIEVRMEKEGERNK